MGIGGGAVPSGACGGAVPSLPPATPTGTNGDTDERLNAVQSYWQSCVGRGGRRRGWGLQAAVSRTRSSCSASGGASYKGSAVRKSSRGSKERGVRRDHTTAWILGAVTRSVVHAAPACGTSSSFTGSQRPACADESRGPRVRCRGHRLAQRVAPGAQAPVVRRAQRPPMQRAAPQARACRSMAQHAIRACGRRGARGPEPPRRLATPTNLARWSFRTARHLSGYEGSRQRRICLSVS